LKVEKDKKASEDSNRAPKPNKKLLDKLKEEMRKLKKPAVSPKPSEEGLKDTLLTIPPLILGDQVQSMNFLKTPDIKSDANGKGDDQDDGKILFTTNDQEVSQSIGSRKRKLDKSGDLNEEEFDGDNTSNSSKDGGDLDESDEEDEGEIKSSDSD